MSELYVIQDLSDSNMTADKIKALLLEKFGDTIDTKDLVVIEVDDAEEVNWVENLFK